jgi:membrane protein DedA with SNARE-associated domain
MSKFLSRKFLVVLVTAILGVIKAEIWPEMPVAAIAGIFGSIIAYLIGQSVVDKAAAE